MNLSLKTFNALIEDMGAALQSSATALVDVSVGSVTRALFEATASVALWLQWLVLLVLQATRASTSVGPDLDSWMADFGLTRLPATASTGTVTFSRYTSNLTAAIPVGTIVKTFDGSMSFAVTQNSSLSIWQPDLGTYIVPIGITTVDLPVACALTGALGNVLPATITVVAASLPGVDLVTNNTAFSDGRDAEDDNAFRERFQLFLASRSRATIMAIRSAVSNVQQGLAMIISENTGVDGSSKTGSFLVTIDDGSGNPPASLLSAVATAVEAVRPIGTTFSVVAPSVMVVNVTLTVVMKSPSLFADYGPRIQTLVADYLNALPIGRPASITRIAQQAYRAGHGIENIMAIELDGSAADVVPADRAVVKAGTILVTANEG